MKQCKKCLRTLSVESFPIHSGEYRRGTCRECLAAYHLAYERRPEQRLKQKEYRLNNRPLFNKYNSAYRKANREKCTAATRERRKAVPGMNRAHLAVMRAVRKGVLVRLPCQVCGKTPTHGHHEDYSRPLDVIWLCHKHHKAIHSRESQP